MSARVGPCHLWRARRGLSVESSGGPPRDPARVLLRSILGSGAQTGGRIPVEACSTSSCTGVVHDLEIMMYYKPERRVYSTSRPTAFNSLAMMNASQRVSSGLQRPNGAARMPGPKHSEFQPAPQRLTSQLPPPWTTLEAPVFLAILYHLSYTLTETITLDPVLPV